MKKKRVLVLCHDVVGSKMAGPGIRYKNVARVLKQVSDVDLAVFSGASHNSSDDIKIINPEDRSYQSIFTEYDVIFAQWLSNDMLSFAKQQNIIVIFDLYAPVPIEYLASLEFSEKKVGETANAEFSNIIEMYNRYFDTADYFTCSNERQRDFWIGYLTANGKLTPTNFSNGSAATKLAVCPMGINKTSPRKNNLALRKKLGLSKDDFVLLWTGGIWDWFDAQLVVRAMSKIKDSSIKLVFMGTKHPNDTVSEMQESKKTRRLSHDLGLTDKSIFFLDGWVPYEDLDSYLLDANASIYCDKESLETRFSHRTRVLDNIWATLPTVCSKGDFLSFIIEQQGLGVVVQQRNEDSFAKVILDLKNDVSLQEQIHKNLVAKRENFSWEITLDPLVKYIRDTPFRSKSTPLHQHTTPINNSTPRRTSTKRRIKNSVKVLLGRIDVA